MKYTRINPANHRMYFARSNLRIQKKYINFSWSSQIERKRKKNEEKKRRKRNKEKSSIDFYPSTRSEKAVNHYLIPTQCWSFISHSTLIWVGPLKKPINHICGVSFEQPHIQFYFSIRFDFITNISCA